MINPIIKSGNKVTKMKKLNGLCSLEWLYVRCLRGFQIGVLCRAVQYRGRPVGNLIQLSVGFTFKVCRLNA